jgi:hypothetical protein
VSHRNSLKEVTDENEQLKKRIKELEKENSRLLCREFEAQQLSESQQDIIHAQQKEALTSQPKRIRKILELTQQNQQLRQTVEEQQNELLTLQNKVVEQQCQINTLTEELEAEVHQRLTTGPRRIRQIHQLLQQQNSTAE